MSQRPKRAFWIALAVVVAIIGAVTVVLAASQSNQRSDLEERFTRRPELNAAFTSSIFSASTSSAAQQEQLTRQYGGKTVSRAALADDAKENNSAFIAVLDEEGQVMAISRGAPRGVAEELNSGPDYIKTVIDGDQPVALSDFLRFGPGSEPVQVFAQPIESEFGTRYLVTGFAPQLLYVFLGETLSEIADITGGDGYIIDSNGAVIASTNPESRSAEPVPVPGLADAVASRDSGSFGDQYFAASPIENSTWKVVSVAPQEDVFASVSGWNKWAPWLILAALALAAAAAKLLLWRVLRNTGELAEAHAQLDASNRALQRRAKDLERSNAELDQFASIASHDLQEPLRKVQMFSQRVSESEADGLSEKGRDYLRRSSEAAGRMQLLIEDLLSFSRVATQGRPFVSTDLGEMVREVASDLEGTITAAGARVEIGELPSVVVDEPQIRQLFQNLISNAIKFRRSDVPPEVHIDGGVDGRYAEVRVRDNGIGFDSRYASRIFRVFERLHGRGEYEGTGIGLALCRKIAERHGGTITAESIPGEGSTFTVTLPVEPLAETAAERAGSTNGRGREAARV